jgi:methylisocitrate lyase
MVTHKVVGVPNAYSAILAEKTGHKAIYLSGSVCAAASYGYVENSS